METVVEVNAIEEEKEDGTEIWYKELTERIKKDEEKNSLILDFSIFPRDSDEEDSARDGQIKKKSIKSIEAEFPILMKHPLVESYLYMKWSIVRKIFL